MTIILLSSTSSIKINAIKYLFDWMHKSDIQITSVDCKELGLPNQPIDCGSFCCYQRSMYAKNVSKQPYDILISIENDLIEVNSQFVDVCHVRMEKNGITSTGKSNQLTCINVDDLMKNNEHIIFSDNIKGFTKTGGSLLHNQFGYDPYNWMESVHKINRQTQILEALMDAWKNNNQNELILSEIKEAVAVYPNFPKKGIDFAYLYSLFIGPAMKKLANVLENKYATYEIDAIFPLESRGLVVGSVLADRFGISLLPVQKPGKVPGEIIKIDYTKEYGGDTFHFSVDIFKLFLQSTKNKSHYHFMIVDDLIATGGSIKAAIDIIDQLSSTFKFTYSLTILALNEIIGLREIAASKIGINYDVVFRNN